MTAETINSAPAPAQEQTSQMNPDEVNATILKTHILPVNVNDLEFSGLSAANNFGKTQGTKETESAQNLRLAAEQLRNGSSPVAFPTETVYGLAADATSSEAVRGIYRAKRRPADNPLIVHFATVNQLRSLLNPNWIDSSVLEDASIGKAANGLQDPIPSIYKPLIDRFWPGPLTILLPLPSPSPLAAEVTNALNTFGARIPASPLALALIRLTGKPLAAPSANASTKPSPTTAEHVLEDMKGRISVILDGGPCEVGVESTVVDGLSYPPSILRPGGVGIGELQSCPGWEGVVNAYEVGDEGQNHSQTNGTSLDSSKHSGTVAAEYAPRAPGMKYRHYSPRARVVLVEPSVWHRIQDIAQTAVMQGQKVGVLSTRSPKVASPNVEQLHIGPSVKEVARGLFAALRDLDRRAVDVIYVEGIDAGEGETAEAVVNRLRKAAGEMILQ